MNHQSLYPLNPDLRSHLILEHLNLHHLKRIHPYLNHLLEKGPTPNCLAGSHLSTTSPWTLGRRATRSTTRTRNLTWPRLADRAIANQMILSLTCKAGIR